MCFKQKTPKTLKTIITWLYKSAAFGWYGMKTLTHIQKKEMCRTHHSRVELWIVHQTLSQKDSLRPTVQCNLYKYESNLVQSLFILLLSGIISDFFTFLQILRKHIYAWWTHYYFFILSLEKYCFQFFPGRQRKTFQMGKSNTFDMICISMFFHKGNVPLIWHVWRQVTCKSFDTSYLLSIYFYSYLSKNISHSNLTPLLSPALYWNLIIFLHTFLFWKEITDFFFFPGQRTE